MNASLLFLLSLPGADSPQPAIEKRIADQTANLVELYKDLHAHPELGFQEVRTAAKLAKELKAAGFEVTEKIGVTGVVAIFKNGAGPTVMVRADMDGLPIIEKTGVPYASKETVRDSEGREVGVMHACGHDINVTCLVGVARVLTAIKDQWKGTLMFIGQPAEEIGAGAKKMIDDGLFKRFPKPDVCLALHCDARFPHGTVNYRSGIMQAHVDSVDILVKGRGGHGAAPHVTIDPVVIAARMILDLQLIVSREQDPTDPAVVTVGSIHGGTKHNIIPNDVKLQLTVRTTKDATRERVLQSIERIAKAAAKGANAPEPEVKIDREAFTPALVNDPDLTKQFVSLFQETLGKENVNERPMSLGGEDFSRFVRAGIPGFYWHLGTAPPERIKEWKEGGKAVAFTHSDGYYPVPEPTIKTGVLTMSMGVLKMLEKR